MAGALIDEDPELAWRHARAARSKGGRIGVVRETVGLVAYRAGEWAEAIAELRAARRMSGGPGQLPVLADCERALGHPEKAIELSRSVEAAELDPASAAELRIVVAGARADMGQLDAALAHLQAAVTADETQPHSGRVFYAYADLLLQAGRRNEAIDYFVKASEMDPDDETDAGERLTELAMDSADSDSSGTEPSGTEPSGTNSSELASSELASTELASTELAPNGTDLGGSDPAAADPGMTERGVTAPGVADPGMTDRGMTGRGKTVLDRTDSAGPNSSVSDRADSDSATDVTPHAPTDLTPGQAELPVQSGDMPSGPTGSTVDSGTIDTGTVDSGTGNSGTVGEGTIGTATVDRGSAGSGTADLSANSMPVAEVANAEEDDDQLSAPDEHLPGHDLGPLFSHDGFGR